jgi:hypothetical protein
MRWRDHRSTSLPGLSRSWLEGADCVREKIALGAVMEIRKETTLSQVLAQLSRSQIDRPAEMITQVFDDYDFQFAESLRLRLDGQARGQDNPTQVFAKMPWGQNPVYQLISEDREAALHFVDAFGGFILPPTHQFYEIRGEGRPLGTVHYFRNIGFVFTDKEPCTALHLIDFEGEKWVVYRSELPSTLLTVTPYAVVTTASGDLVAIMVIQRGWGLPKNCLKLFRPVPAVCIPLMMAIFHGLQMTRSVDPSQRDAALARAFGSGTDAVAWP